MNIDRTVTLRMLRNIDTCVRIRTDTLVTAVGTFVWEVIKFESRNDGEMKQNTNSIE
jgi:hypothetical protein